MCVYLVPPSETPVDNPVSVVSMCLDYVSGFFTHLVSDVIHSPPLHSNTTHCNGSHTLCNPIPLTVIRMPQQDGWEVFVQGLMFLS